MSPACCRNVKNNRFNEKGLMRMKILIGGDFVPTESNRTLFEQGDAESLVGTELKSIFEKSDLNVFNLEVPISDNESPIFKCGPALRAGSGSVNGFKKCDVGFFTLANNHILDQGQKGLESTIKLLEDNGIAYAGAGENLARAQEPYIFESDERKVGFYCCAEHEFSIATENGCGANPFDPLESLDHIQNLKQECDYVIVLYHGGKEHYRYPSPELQRVCRKIADKGADLIICQHSHCIGCEEKYRGKTIVYGQGNFIFDKNPDNEFWKTSLLICLDWDHSKTPIITYLPLQRVANGVRVANSEFADKIMQDFKDRSNKIKDRGFIQAEYNKFVDGMLWIYLCEMLGKRTKNIFFRVLNKLSDCKLAKHIAKAGFSKAGYANLYNYINCEAHREIILNGLERHYKE